MAGPNVVFQVQSELPNMVETLNKMYPEQWRPILSDALNETASYCTNVYRNALPKYFDRPTDYTLNSLVPRKASPNKLVAEVVFKDNPTQISPGHYLEPETRGGSRRDKRFERSLIYAGLMPDGYFTVPTDRIALDPYGNVPAGLYTKILSALKASFDTTQNQSVVKGYKGKSDNFIKKYRAGLVDQAKVAARDTANRRKSAKYFVIKVGQGGGLFPGIYESQVLFGSRASRRVFSFVRAVNYKNTFPFAQIGQDAARKKLPQKIKEAIDKLGVKR